MKTINNCNDLPPNSNIACFNNGIKFKHLKIGEEFECYGDVNLNYNYPKICKCVKDGEDLAHEIDGINFWINKNDIVF